MQYKISFLKLQVSFLLLVKINSVKIRKIRTRKNCYNYPKIWTIWLDHRVTKCIQTMQTEWQRSDWATSWQNQQNECAPSEDSDQPGHPPSLIKVYAVHMKKVWVLSYPIWAHSEDWSNWADAQADLCLCWVHTHFVGFVVSWLRLVWTVCLKSLNYYGKPATKRVWCVSVKPKVEKKCAQS